MQTPSHFSEHRLILTHKKAKRNLLLKRFAQTLLRVQIDSKKYSSLLFKIINIVIFAVQTVDFDVTICLPPGGRGTVEAVEGARAIEL